MKKNLLFATLALAVFVAGCSSPRSSSSSGRKACGGYTRVTGR